MRSDDWVITSSNDDEAQAAGKCTNRFTLEVKQQQQRQRKNNFYSLEISNTPHNLTPLNSLHSNASLDMAKKRTIRFLPQLI